MAIYSIAELNSRLFNHIADLHPISFTFLRFSTTPLDEQQQMLGLPSLQLLFAFIHTAVCYIHHYQYKLSVKKCIAFQFLRIFDENLPANQQAQTVVCRNVTRRLAVSLN